MTFTLRKGCCPPVIFNNCQLPQVEEAKYLGIHMDRRLNWQRHIFTKRKCLGMKLRTMYWLIDKKSKLTLDNKLLLYKAILKPVWTYGAQIWGSASKSNIEIIQRFQSKVLRIIANAPWYISNDIIHHDLKMATVQEEINKCSKNYYSRLCNHPNNLALELLSTGNDTRRLKRHRPADLHSIIS